MLDGADESGNRTRVALVLGGGGVLGAAWMMGALQAIVEESGWEPTDAEVVAGTSAGALVGALAASGARPWDVLSPDRAEFYDDLQAASEFRLNGRYRPWRPGSWSMARAAWRRRAFWPQVVAALAPQGPISTLPIRRLIERHAPGGWPVRPRLWALATDYSTGEGVVFGRDGAPPARLSDAVAASCAIPGFYAPVEIGGRLYVDGGLSSPASLDLLVDSSLELAICLSPLSGGRETGARGFLRHSLHRSLMTQARHVEASGTRVVVIEPTNEAARLIGRNPMSRRRRAAVGAAAAASVRETLSELDLEELRAARR